MPGGEQQLGAEQRGVGRDRRRDPEQRAEEHPRLPPVAGDRVGGVVLEGRRRRRATASGRATHSWAPCSIGGAGRRHLGVADPAAGGHQVDLAGADHRVVAGAVAVLDLAGEEPAHRLQPGVRVRGDRHAAGVGDLVGAVVVDEAPRADQRPVALRQRAAYGHRPRPARAGPPAAPAPRHRRRCPRPPGPARRGRARGWSCRPQARWCGSSVRSEPGPLVGRPVAVARRRVPGRSRRTTTDLETGGVALLRGRVERDQRVGLRVVGRGAAARLVVGHDPEGPRHPLGAVAPLADQVDDVAVGEAERRAMSSG